MEVNVTLSNSRITAVISSDLRLVCLGVSMSIPNVLVVIPIHYFFLF